MFRKASTAGAVAPPKIRWTEALSDAAILRFHDLAVRLDRVPQEFGDAEAVDETDPQALRREWLRQFRIWSDSSPEQLFAIKVAAVLGGGALVLVLILISAI